MKHADRISALRTQHAAVSTLCSTISDDQWHAPSNATGWSTGDVIAHMSSTCRLLLTADALRAMTTGSIERLNDRFVESRRAWGREQVAAEFAAWGGRCITLLDAVGRTPAGAIRVPVGDIGQFPVSKFPSMLTFDWHTHLAYDIAKALGRPSIPLSTLDLSVVVEWMMAVLAQSGVAAAFVPGPIVLRLTGVMEDEWLLQARKNKVRITPGSGECVATIEGRAVDFPSWGTTRTSWRDHDLQISGDNAAAIRLLDSINII